MAAPSRKMKLRYYEKGTVVPFEEDDTHEFKGHRNMSVEEVPETARLNNSTKRSRKAVSRNINAFLNSGKGGTIYLGIIDDGTVLGLNMTTYQKDHVITCLDDLARRYDPPMQKHQYKIRFVPVLAPKAIEEDPSILAEIDRLSEAVDKESRLRPHVCQTSAYCWCDKDAVAVLNGGIFATDYVIEIIIKPWDPEDERNKTLVLGTDHKLPPFHADEEGNVYFRRLGSIVQYAPQEIWTMTQQEVKEICQAEIDALRQEIVRLKTSSKSAS